MREFYQQQIRQSDEEIQKLSKKINSYSFGRLIIIIGGFLLIYTTTTFQRVWLTELAFFFVVIVFGLLVREQSRLGRKKSYAERFRKVNNNELSVTTGKDNMYPDGTQWTDDNHFYSSDLDIFGRSSLFALINRCATYAGNNILAGWLSAPGTKTETVHRQEAMLEIASDIRWKQRFHTLLLATGTEQAKQTEKLFSYLKAEPSGKGRILELYVKFVPLVFLILLAGAFYIHFLLIPLLLLVLANLGLAISKSGEIAAATEAIKKVAGFMETCSFAVAEIEGREWKSPLAKELGESLADSGGKSYSAQMGRLSALINRLDLNAPVLIIFALNASVLWHVRYYLAIAKWKERGAVNVERAFNVVARFEALASLAGIRQNYPDWCIPDVTDDENFTLITENAGHPLLPAETRVTNTYSLDHTRKIDIITGSNMAGKSTFLRTVGINTVLALAGAPACASAMKVCPVHLFSYMRIRDSLTESTSTFKAELNRLQMLLDALQKHEKIFFLIDEMLRGTNSEDKYRGSKAIIEKLIAMRSVGIVATHDLQIAGLKEKYPDYIRNYYFDIQVEENEMHFDYKLKEGECKTFNASLLLKKLGIETGGG